MQEPTAGIESKVPEPMAGIKPESRCRLTLAAPRPPARAGVASGGTQQVPWRDVAGSELAQLMDAFSAFAPSPVGRRG